MSLLRPALRLARLPLARSASSSAATPALNLASAPKAPGQSPNVPTPWSPQQEAKKDAFNQARFEQTAFDLQPHGLSAMGLVNEVPIVKVAGRKAVCNGGESGWTGGVEWSGFGEQCWEVGGHVGACSKHRCAHLRLGLREDPPRLDPLPAVCEPY
jgi:NADH dehydrogenase (ubiquinone) Fe-S protein 6